MDGLVEYQRRRPYKTYLEIPHVIGEFVLTYLRQSIQDRAFINTVTSCRTFLKQGANYLTISNESMIWNSEDLLCQERLQIMSLLRFKLENERIKTLYQDEVTTITIGSNRLKYLFGSKLIGTIKEKRFYEQLFSMFNKTKIIILRYYVWCDSKNRPSNWSISEFVALWPESVKVVKLITVNDNLNNGISKFVKNPIGQYTSNLAYRILEIRDSITEVTLVSERDSSYHSLIR